MRDKLGERLPTFSMKDKELLRNSVDFIGLNHYTSRFVTSATTNEEENDFYRAQEVERIGKYDFLITIYSAVKSCDLSLHLSPSISF